jgi:hypothetical protein
MEVPHGWKAVGYGRGKGIVLMLDFEAVGRREACFADLVPMLDPAPETWTAAQPSHGSLDKTACAYLGYWSGGLRESGREVHAVLGFCAGAVFAAALAEQIAGWQARVPEVVLLDPEPPTTSTLLGQFENVIQALAGLASAAAEGPGRSDTEGLDRARAAAARLRDVADLPALGDELSSLYREVTEPAFARIGLSPVYQADLVMSFGSLMSYLAAAGDLRPGPGWASATAVVSAAHRGQPAGRQPIGVARQVSVDTDHADLLRSPAVAKLVSELLQ